VAHCLSGSRLACPSMPTTCDSEQHLGAACLARQELGVPELAAFHKQHSLRWPWRAGCRAYRRLRRELPCADALAPPRIGQSCAQRSLAKVLMACARRNTCTSRKTGDALTLNMLASVQDHARCHSLMLGRSATRELAPAATAAAVAAAAAVVAQATTGPITKTTQFISPFRTKPSCPTPALQQQQHTAGVTRLPRFAAE